MHANGDEALVVGLIGAGIGESLSPALHEREASLLGFDYEYRLFDLEELERPAADVGELVREAARGGLRGLNITHPCKQLVVGGSTTSRRRRPPSARSTRSCCATGG